MTRINIGIHPRELCDQMLIADYRELPRMRQFAHERYARYGRVGPRPTTPTLGTGHMAFWLPYGPALEAHYNATCDEMRRRGFRPTLEWRGYMFQELYLTPEEEAACRALLIPRIRERLAAMKRTPTWTNSQRPEWAEV